MLYARFFTAANPVFSCVGPTQSSPTPAMSGQTPDMLYGRSYALSVDVKQHDSDSFTAAHPVFSFLRSRPRDLFAFVTTLSVCASLDRCEVRVTPGYLALSTGHALSDGKVMYLVLSTGQSLSDGKTMCLALSAGHALCDGKTMCLALSTGHALSDGKMMY